MAIKEYEPGTAFPGVMGRTVGESSPAWPRPLRAKPGSPERPLHRPRRHRLRAARLLRLADPDAQPGRLAGERPALQQHAHDRALLAQPLVHADRPQPPLERDGVHHRGRDRLPGLERPHPVRERLPVRDAAGARLQHVRARQVAPDADRAVQRRPAPTIAGRSAAASSASTASWAATRTSTTRTWSTTTTRSQPPRTPEQGYHLTEDLVDHAIEFIADAKQVAPDKPFFMYFCTGRDARAPPRARANGPTSTRASSTTAGTPTGEKVFERQLAARHRAAGHAAVARAIPTSRPGTAWAPTRSASTRG